MENIKNKSTAPKYSLEPLNYGQIIDRTFRLFKDNFGQLIIAVLKTYIPYMIFSGLIFVFTLMGGQLLIIGNKLSQFSGIVYSLCTIVLIGYVSKMISEIYKGFPSDPASINIKTAGLFGKTFITSLYYGFCVSVLAFLTGSSGFILTAMLGGIIGPIGMIIGICVTAFLLFITVKWAFSNSLAVYMPALEGLSGNSALQRSQQLFNSNKESMGKVILIPILIQILLTVIYFASLFTPLILMIVVKVFLSKTIITIIAFIVTAIIFLLSPLPIIAMTVVYFDIRIRTEGFDMHAKVISSPTPSNIEDLSSFSE